VQNLVRSGDGFYADHRYKSPEDYGVQQSMTHTVTVTLNTGSGTKHVTLKVRNVL